MKPKLQRRSWPPSLTRPLIISAMANNLYLQGFAALSFILMSLLMAPSAKAQTFPRAVNDTVSVEVEAIYKRSLRYLSNTQSADGAWGGGT